MVEAGSVGDAAEGGEKVYGVTSHLTRNQYSRMDPFPWHLFFFYCVDSIYKNEEEKADHHHISYFVSKHKTQRPLC